MGAVTSQIPVPFHGSGAGDGELTWGQQGIWITMLRTGRTMNIGGAMPLPEGSALSEFESSLRFLMSRHESLRTRLRFDDDGWPRQVVSASGEATLDVVDIDAADDPAEAAEALRSRYEFTPFDHVHEWPVRMGLIRQQGALTHFVVQYSHLSVDGSGIEAVVRDLAHLDPQTGAATAAVSGIRPLALAAKQRGPVGRRQSERALRYWESLLRVIPAQRFGVSAEPQQPRFWEIVCHSPAMYLALQAVADRTRADTGHVLLAAYAVALARVTGRSPSVAQVLVNNRFRPDFANSVSHLTQTGICVIDVADAAFDDVVAQAWNAATNAHLHGYFDTIAHQEMLARVARERGEEIDISCFVNDRRAQSAPVASGNPTPAEIRAALPFTTVRWERKLDTYDGAFYLHVDASPGAVEFAIWADTHRLSLAEIEMCAHELEAVTVRAALDPRSTTGVPAATAANS